MTTRDAHRSHLRARVRRVRVYGRTRVLAGAGKSEHIERYSRCCAFAVRQVLDHSRK